ncbi:MAG: DCC1-like thiol-disulfide oxidoreductase family protein [Ferruginibacter sp.]
MKNNRLILIYDDKCPLCAAYTKFFVTTGILSSSGRKSFSSVDPALLQLTDPLRSNNEIPLIDTQTGQVLYGIDALLELLNTKLYGIKVIGRFAPVYWLLKKLYRFISYNRKVVVAARCSEGEYDCSPAFNYKWRLIFLFGFLLFNTIALFPVQSYVVSNSFFSGSSIFYVQVLHAFLVASNLLLAVTLKKQRAFEYLGQVNMLATIAVLGMLLLAGINKYLFVNLFFNNGFLLLLLVVIVKEYIRRMRFAGTLQLKYITISNACCIMVFLAAMTVKL